MQIPLNYSKLYAYGEFLPIEEEDLTKDKYLLYSLMSQISEEVVKASWIEGNEIYIWTRLQEEKDLESAPGLLQKVAELSTKLQGWIVWLDKETNPNLSLPEQWGPRFVPLDVWKESIGSLTKLV